MAERMRAASSAGRDIGPLPEVVDPDRKARCSSSLQLFAETYFPEVCYLGWSRDHLKMIAKLERAARDGGCFAFAMPRGNGKTAICVIAAIWAILYGHKRFVAMIGATEKKAKELLDDARMHLETNTILLDDFPEVCYPIVKLKGIVRRAQGQTLDGENTNITIEKEELIMPTVPGSVASESVIKIAGITGSIRGMHLTRRDGKIARPDFVIVDDPQTEESAKSLSQNEFRLSVLNGAILGLAGPGEPLACVCPCTVIYPGDMADRILNPKDYPDWQGERGKALYSLPDDKEKWERYRELRAESLRMHGDIRLATEYYAANRAEMDAGADVAWPDRHKPDEISGLQHCMNLKFKNERAFFSEQQNEPLSATDGLFDADLSVDDICQKLSGIDVGVVPSGMGNVTAFIDIQQRLLYWAVCAWDDRFNGSVIGYGAYPDPAREHFTLDNIDKTLQDLAPETGIEGAIYAGLDTLVRQLLGHEWMRVDGIPMRINQCMIDANWGTSTDLVYQFCRKHPSAALLLPSHGRYVGASSKPFSEYRKDAGDKIGLNWRIPGTAGKRGQRHVLFDANFWKSFVHSRIATPAGDRGSLLLYGKAPSRHVMIAEHLTAEYRVKTTGRGRTVDEWKMRPDRRDNHLLDCVAGCAVGASMLGSSLEELQRGNGGPRKKISFAEMQRARRGR